MSELRERLKEIICRQCDGISHADTCELEKDDCPVLRDMPDQILSEVQAEIEKCGLTDEELAGAVNRKADEIYIVPSRLIAQAMKEKILEALK